MTGSKYRARVHNWMGLLVLGGSLSAPALAVPMYDIQLLGALGDGISYSVASDFNNAGQVVGYSGNAGVEAFIWDADNGMQGLGVMPDSAQSYAFAINENGQVTGTNEWRSGDGLSVHREAFIWDGDNGMQGLGTLNDEIRLSEGHDINDAGQVVGVSRVVEDPTRVTVDENGTTTIGYYEHQAFVWDADGGIRSLGEPASASGNLFYTAVNNSGQVIADLHRGNTTDGLDAGPSIGDIPRRPMRIEDDGRVPAHNPPATPGFWNLDGVFTPLAADQPDQFGTAFDVNSLGQVIGFRPGEEFDGSSFLFDNGEFFEITDLINGDFYLFFAAAINDLGQIAGTAFSSTDFNVIQAAILTPVGFEPPEPPLAVPEPPMAPLVLGGLISLFVLRGRQKR